MSVFHISQEFVGVSKMTKIDMTLGSTGTTKQRFRLNQPQITVLGVELY